MGKCYYTVTDVRNTYMIWIKILANPHANVFVHPIIPLANTLLSLLIGPAEYHGVSHLACRPVAHHFHGLECTLAETHLRLRRRCFDPQ